jgi:hypothetical protein
VSLDPGLLSISLHFNRAFFVVVVVVWWIVIGLSCYFVSFYDVYVYTCLEK